MDCPEPVAHQYSPGVQLEGGGTTGLSGEDEGRREGDTVGGVGEGDDMNKHVLLISSGYAD